MTSIFSIQNILKLLIAYRYAIIFPISILEGPIITIISGLLVSIGSLNLYVVFGVLVVGDVVGDMVYYAIGRFGRNPFIRRWGKYFGIQEDTLEHFENRFKNHETSILLLGKAQPIGSIVLATAGFVKMRFDKFVLINFIGTAIKTAILLTVGYYFGKAYVTIDNYLTRGGIIFSLVVIIGAIVYFIYYKRKKI